MMFAVGVSEFRHLAEFSNAFCSKLNDVENEAKFRTFAPPSSKS